MSISARASMFVLAAAATLGCGVKRAVPPAAKVPRTCTATPIQPTTTSLPDAGGLGPAAAIAVVDLDGDQSLDVVVSRGVPHERGSVDVHYARDRGGDWAGAPRVIAKRVSNGGVAVAELGGDGCLDLAVAREQAGDARVGVDVYLGRARAGRCELDELPVTVAMPTCERCDHTFGTRVAAGDFDGDGRQDLAVAQSKVSARQPVEQYLCLATGASELPFACRATQTHLGGALEVLSLDADADGVTDALFGGVGVGPTADHQTYTHPDAWGLLVLASGQELVIADGAIRDNNAAPNLMDLAPLPGQPGRGPRVAAVFGDRKCSSGCAEASVAKVFELTVSADRSSVAAELLWTSEGSCHGALQAVTPVRLVADANPALVLSHLRGTRGAPETGALVIVPGTATGWGRQETWRSIDGIYVHALAAAPRADGRPLDDLLYSTYVKGGGAPPVHRIAGAELLGPR